jgi:hypothetical protein
MFNGESQKSKTCSELYEGLKIQKKNLRFFIDNNLVTLRLPSGWH